MTCNNLVAVDTDDLVSEENKIDAVKHDAEIAADIFSRYGIPALRRFFRSSKIVCVENLDFEDPESFLDLRCAIDYLVADENGYIQGIAARAQSGFCYKTFTIRASRKSGVKTEYQKIANPVAVRAGYYCHVYQLNDGSAFVGISQTVNILRAIWRHGEKQFLKPNSTGETFLAVPWRLVEDTTVYHIGSDGKFINDPPN